MAADAFRHLMMSQKSQKARYRHTTVLKWIPLMALPQFTTGTLLIPLKLISCMPRSPSFRRKYYYSIRAIWFTPASQCSHDMRNILWCDMISTALPLSCLARSASSIGLDSYMAYYSFSLRALLMMPFTHITEYAYWDYLLAYVIADMTDIISFAFHRLCMISSIRHKVVLAYRRKMLLNRVEHYRSATGQVYRSQPPLRTSYLMMIDEECVTAICKAFDEIFAYR